MTASEIFVDSSLTHSTKKNGYHLISYAALDILTATPTCCCFALEIGNSCDIYVGNGINDYKWNILSIFSSHVSRKDLSMMISYCRFENYEMRMWKVLLHDQELDDDATWISEIKRLTFLSFSSRIRLQRLHFYIVFKTQLVNISRTNVSVFVQEKALKLIRFRQNLKLLVEPKQIYA